MTKANPIAVGDEVAYSAAFLRSTAQQTGEMPFRRGIVIASEPLGDRSLCRVRWSDGQESNVLDANLARPGSRAFAEA
ncbi:hypothetical protein [Sphingomonas oryzagri]